MKMTVTQDLGRVWYEIVASGVISNEFLGERGKRIKVGLKIGSNGEVVDFATDMGESSEISARVEERTVPGTNIILQYNEFRGLKPGGKPKEIGKQQ